MRSKKTRKSIEVGELNTEFHFSILVDAPFLLSSDGKVYKVQHISKRPFIVENTEKLIDLLLQTQCMALFLSASFQQFHLSESSLCSLFRCLLVLLLNFILMLHKLAPSFVES